MAHQDTKDLGLNIDKSALKSLYQIKPLRHAADIAFNWALILGTIVLSVKLANPFMYVLAVLIIGARMHALAILMHDATHFRFMKNRKMSDLITNFVSMYPLFTSIEQYRQNHLNHHQHLNTEHDPDWVAKLGKAEFTFPKTKTEFLAQVASYFFLVQGIKDAIWFLKRFAVPQKKKKNTNPNQKYQKLGFYLLLTIALSVLGGWKYFAMYWVVPYFSTFFMYQYIRSVAEHFGDLAYDNPLTASRTTYANPVEKFFLSPHNVGYHLEHHLYPGVPYYNLDKLHDLLMESPVYNETAHVTVGYTKGLLSELGNPQLQEMEMSPHHHSHDHYPHNFLPNN